MKILKKNESLALAERQKREQIDEGITLIRKTDDLRQELAQVQQQHSDFIKGMKAELAREIEPLKEQKVVLLAEVATATRELARLREPLDAEWADVKKVKAENDKEAQVLAMREQAVVTAQQEVIKDKADISKERQEIDALRQEASDKNVEASDRLTEADRVLEKANAYSDHKHQELDGRERELTEWETELNYREVDLDNRSAFLDKREEDIKSAEIQVNDRYETMMREINRKK